MRETTTEVRREALHYGWVVLAASFVTALLTTGVQTSFGVFLKPLQDDFGWTRAAISLVPSLNLVVTCLFFPIAGWFADNYGPKAIVALGGLSAGLGMVLVSRISAPWQLYIYYGLLVGLGVGCASTPITATVTRWFEKRRGLALGIVQSGTAVGTITLAPLAGYLLSSYGWRTSYLVIGLATWVVVVAALVLRKGPSAELLTDEQASDVGQTKVAFDQKGLSLTEAVRTRAFWLLFLAYVLSYGTLMMVMYHLVARAEDAGISGGTAASLLSAVGGGNIIGFVLGGLASDRLGRKPIMVFSLVLQSALMILLIKASSAWMFYVFSALWGMIVGGWAPLMPTVAGELFGLRRIGSIVGAVSMTYGIGGAIGLSLAGSVFTATGSYTVAFVVGAVALLSSAIAVLLLKPPRTSQSDTTLPEVVESPQA